MALSCEPLICLICETSSMLTRLILREICRIRTESWLSCVVKGRLLLITIIKSRQAGREDWPEESVPVRRQSEGLPTLLKDLCVRRGHEGGSG